MIRYDWIILSKYKLSTIMDIIYVLENRENLEYSRRIILKAISSFVDNSAFLIRPMNLIANKKKHTDNEIYLYLELAAYRSYFDYKQTGRITLPTDYIKGRYDLEKLKLNTALIVTREYIFFKYEEK